MQTPKDSLEEFELQTTGVSCMLGEMSELLTILHLSTVAYCCVQLFRREGQSGGKKVVSMLSLLGDGVKMEGKVKIRLSSLLPNHPQLVTLPLEGESSGFYLSGEVQLILYCCGS